MGRKILVVGSGFAGFWAATAARRTGGRDVDITMLSREPVLQIRPRLYEAQPEAFQLPLEPLLDMLEVEFTSGEAVDIDLSSRTIECLHGSKLHYDRLVVATGSLMRPLDLPGSSTTYSIDTVADAVRLDSKLATIARQVAEPVIAIVGAGFTGIELALEMRDRLAAHGRSETARRAHVVLIDRAGIIGPELGAGPRPQIEAALAEAQVELRLGANLSALDPLTFSDGEILQADAVVLTTGMRAADFVGKLPGEFDVLGRLVVEPTLRAPAAPDIFVAGDAACADTGDGRRTLQSCQHALQLGRVAGENAARDQLKLPLITYRQPRYVTCLDLGRSGAVLTEGWDRTVAKTGAAAKAVKRWINREVIYPPGKLDRETLLAASRVPLQHEGAGIR